MPQFIIIEMEWQSDFCWSRAVWWLGLLAALVHTTQTRSQCRVKIRSSVIFKCLPLETCFHHIGLHDKSSTHFQSTSTTREVPWSCGQNSVLKLKCFHFFMTQSVYYRSMISKGHLLDQSSNRGRIQGSRYHPSKWRCPTVPDSCEWALGHPCSMVFSQA